jgi:uncharacterized RDD family membrane protein YckC
VSTDRIPAHVGEPFAGFWRRVGAWFVDALIIYTIYLLVAFFIWDDLLVRATIQDPETGQMLTSYMPSLLGVLLVGFATLAYFALQEASPAQATLGKRMFGIKVCDYNGDRIGIVTAGLRSWPLWLPGFINTLPILDFVIGLVSLGACVSVAFTQRKQGLHDILARCLVVKRQAVFSDVSERFS